MKFIYGTGRGGLTLSKTESSKNESVLGATLHGGGESLAGGKFGGPIVTAAEIMLSERYAITPCFGGQNFLYTFGIDASASQIVMSAVTTVDGGPCDAKAPQVATSVLDYVKAARASVATAPCDITIGSLAIAGRIVKMNVGTVDSASNLMRVTYVIVLPQFLGGG